MKLMTYIICLSQVLSFSAYGRNSGNIIGEKYTYPLSRSEEQHKLKEVLRIKNIESIDLLRTVKYLMTSGQLDKAKILLKDASITNDFSKKIQYRYLAMINFIEGDHQKVIDILNTKEMNEFAGKSKYCQINILSHIILNKVNNLKEKWYECYKVTISKSKSELLWFKTIVDLKTSRSKSVINDIFKEVSVDNLDGDNLRIYLKLALYLNRQDAVTPRFQYFNKETLQSSMFRELIGMNYFRDMQLVKAYQLLDGLDSPNAEVFRGNLYLIQKKLHAAFAQYKLALKKKDNSDNALERLIPLSWQLGQWNEGIEFTKRLSIGEKSNLEKSSLLAAFYTMAGKDEKANKVIRNILAKTNKSIPVELNQVMTYNSIIFNKNFEAEESAMSNCLKRDGLHCWYLFYHTTLNSPTETLQKTELIHDKTKDLVSFYSQETINDPIQEEIFVDQKDIESLDNDLIKLIESK